MSNSGIPCHDCGKVRRQGLYSVFEGGLYLCRRCLPGNSIGEHGRRYPECPEDWHDMWDHLYCLADRRALPFAIEKARADS